MAYLPILAILILSEERFIWKDYIEATSSKTTSAFDSHPIIGIFSFGVLWLLSSTGLDSGGLGRFLASKSNKVARNSTVAAGVFMAIWLVLTVSTLFEPLVASFLAYSMAFSLLPC